MACSASAEPQLWPPHVLRKQTPGVQPWELHVYAMHAGSMWQRQPVKHMQGAHLLTVHARRLARLSCTFARRALTGCRSGTDELTAHGQSLVPSASILQRGPSRARPLPWLWPRLICNTRADPNPVPFATPGPRLICNTICNTRAPHLQLQGPVSFATPGPRLICNTRADPNPIPFATPGPRLICNTRADPNPQSPCQPSSHQLTLTPYHCYHPANMKLHACPAPRMQTQTHKRKANSHSCVQRQHTLQTRRRHCSQTHVITHTYVPPLPVPARPSPQPD